MVGAAIAPVQKSLSSLSFLMAPQNVGARSEDDHPTTSALDCADLIAVEFSVAMGCIEIMPDAYRHLAKVVAIV